MLKSAECLPLTVPCCPGCVPLLAAGRGIVPRGCGCPTWPPGLAPDFACEPSEDCRGVPAHPLPLQGRQEATGSLWRAGPPTRQRNVSSQHGAGSTTRDAHTDGDMERVPPQTGGVPAGQGRLVEDIDVGGRRTTRNIQISLPSSASGFSLHLGSTSTTCVTAAAGHDGPPPARARGTETTQRAPRRGGTRRVCDEMGG